MAKSKLAIWFSLSQWKKMLYRHYSASLSQTFKQFKLGAVLFTVGFIIIYLANQTMLPSMKQEVFVLLGIIIAGIGFIFALLAHIRMLISRILIFLKK